MIDFRYHVVSLAALFLALAGGIALGAGPLQGDVQTQLAAATGDDAASDVSAELDDAEGLEEFQSAYGAGTATPVLDGRLDQTSVAVIVLPGADAAVVRALRQDLTTADANVVSTVTLAPNLVDPAKRQLAEGLAEQVLRNAEDNAATDGATGYELVGGALGRAFLTGSTSASAQDSTAESTQAAFEEASLVSVDGVVLGRAQLALVVSGDPRDEAPDGETEVVAGLLAGMESAAGGAVVAGTLGSSTDGVVALVRDSDLAADVSTVDPVETTTGRIVTVLALAEQAAGRAGEYGVDAADGAVPDLALD